MDHNHLRYIYLRDLKKQPLACIAVAYDKKKSSIRYAISTLNPQDQFNRDVARDLAVGRLAQDKSSKLDLSELTKVDCHVITRTIMKDLITWENEELPSRTRKAARRWLLQDSQRLENKSSKVIQLFGGTALRV